MFHRATDMSKVALVALVRSLFAAGIRLLDVQFATTHLRTLGAFEVPRAEYLRRLAVAVPLVVDLRGVVLDLDDRAGGEPEVAPP
jgi:leucyl/phenylalanyl-tRNA--protein transferase